MKGNEEAMSCEELQKLAMNGKQPGGAASDAEHAAWEAHLEHCANCAAYQNTQLELRARLRELAAGTAAEQTPWRIEALLRREVAALGPRKESPWNRRGLALAVLAAAAVLVAAAVLRQSSPYVAPVAGVQPPPAIAAPPEISDSAEAAAENATAAGDFVLLPGGIPDAGDDSAILRVRLQRGELASMGLTVNEEASAEWVMVDLLVGPDGQPQAVRLLR
jgi:anti-sigma factor RsiW